MALEGSIKDFGIADIFQLINLQKKSGILTIQNNEAIASINFVGGEIVYAVSTTIGTIGPTAPFEKTGENERIGRLLIGLGKLTEKALEDALLTQQNTGEKTGHILIAAGEITKDDLKEVLQIQIKDVIFKAFRWKDGRYKFDASEVEYETEYQIPIPTDFILMEGIRMLDEWPYIASHISSEYAIFSQALKGEEAESLFSSLTNEEMNVFNLIDGTRNVQDIEQLVNLTEFEVYRTLAALKVAGLIEETGKGIEGTACIPPPLETIASSPQIGTMGEGPGEAEVFQSATPPLENEGEEGFEVPSYEEKPEKRRIWAAVQIAILIFIISSIFIFFSLGEIGGIKDYYSAYNRIRKFSAVESLDYLRNAITFYQKANGNLPESLEVLYNKHFINKDTLTDPWENKFVYEILPQGYRLYSKGPDGLSGTVDDLVI